MGTSKPKAPGWRAAGRGAAAYALALALAVPAAGQGSLDPLLELDLERPEVWAMRYFASATLFTGMGPVPESEPGSLEVALEAGWVPHLDAEQRRVGFFGTKEEDLNKTALLGRPRLAVGLPGRVTLTLSYVPPVEVFGVEPHLLAVSAGRPLAGGRRWRLGGRLTAQAGRLEGDFTCSAETVAAGEDRTRNPFGCEAPSRDVSRLASGSFELTAGLPSGRRLQPYLAAAAHFLDLGFDVHARYSGIEDATRFRAAGWNWSAAAGLGFPLAGGLRGVIEAFYTPLDVQRSRRAPVVNDPLFNARLLVAYRVR